ncbi:metallophosphoesterase family protein [Sphingobacterium griseoflavum]|uniref:Metallophosphoesterase n=1 Tax=Sphingobacterium griseoflavum TaxID=1474952 RepID=A0ABQ3HSM3_9SPHI|nr:metallophosphoesterase [Sphingobacterium griseoflavum]GHE30860.1 metallophosphoesterase [Sphingobacterium griseoflavum]
MATRERIKIAAVGDLHVKINDKGKWKNCFEEISSLADVLLICGDLTDTGDEEEAEILAEELHSLHIPAVGVLGNHDYEKGRQKLIRQTLLSSNFQLLDGESVVIRDTGFAGVKGFGGGFDRYMLSMFGEEAMKAFVQESVDESMRLDRSLARLEQEYPDIPKVAILHYSPTAETVQGEPVEIFPFLGSSLLAEPLLRRQVSAVFHGHAHAGQLTGSLAENLSVYNVALPVLKTHQPGQDFFMIEV